MFLTEKYHALLPFHHHRKAPPSPSPAVVAASDASSGSRFEAALAARLGTLLPLLASSSPLALLARVADLLAATLADAAPALLAGAGGDASAAAVAEHLEAGVALLDACNAIAARVDRLRRRRLLARFALHLLSPPQPLSASSTARARAALADRAAVDPNSPPLPSIPFHPPRRHKPAAAAARVLLAVNAVSSLAASAAAAILDHSNTKTTTLLVPVTSNLPWAEPFNAVSISLSALALSSASTTEADAEEESVGKLASALENEEGSDEAAVRAAAKEVEARTEELAARLDRLSDAVNGVFRAALRLRDAELGTFMAAGPALQTPRK
ncbi:uncharacterized protein LOC100835482 [Brachypodium distachyon]|uniref:Uncharacterized protein n=1 Tax=Brachypodium distachyon TaxID=15368 RepID=I1J3A0_BRADI|nr:uncharacterized protein LOC100835482 [Brachypodium distachyon]KQJ85254.1 hypothetical protein BRADI_5g25900v3 [Brachypodium distachyon]|eukprot:XP_003579466.1 uncharacterized protein LOC100835482 [Brachypodium distachyon]